ncbi:putative transcription elongation factor SPT5 homolog 1 [Tanacetum coccineum]
MCEIGHEREVVVYLMQKCIDKAVEMQIRSAIAFDHLKNYNYSEADKEAHVREFSIIIPCFSFKDDGKGMDPEAMRHCLSFVFSDKSSFP